jgi:signal transduction histidine kinase
LPPFRVGTRFREPGSSGKTISLLASEEKLATLGKLVGCVAHELRNPLGVVQSCIFTLRESLGHSEPKVLEQLDVMESAVWRARKVVDDLLQYSRCRAGQPNLCDLQLILDECLSAAEESGTVTVHRSHPPHACHAWADPDHLRHIFDNLIQNSMEAMGEGGGDLHVTIEPMEDKVRVILCDTAPGVSEETASRLFEPLFTTKPGGVGLGLAVAKELVGRNGGAIGFLRGDAGGLEFHVVLPGGPSQERAGSGKDFGNAR